MIATDISDNATCNHKTVRLSAQNLFGNTKYVSKHAIF